MMSPKILKRAITIFQILLTQNKLTNNIFPWFIVARLQRETFTKILVYVIGK